jgi:hypothetical protein
VGTSGPHFVDSATGLVAKVKANRVHPTKMVVGYATVIGNDPELPDIGRAFPRSIRSSCDLGSSSETEMTHTATTTSSLDSRLERHVKNHRNAECFYLLLATSLICGC